MINTITSKSFLVKANCVAAVASGIVAVFASPWFFILAALNLAAAIFALRSKK